MRPWIFFSGLWNGSWYFLVEVVIVVIEVVIVSIWRDYNETEPTIAKKWVFHSSSKCYIDAVVLRLIGRVHWVSTFYRSLLKWYNFDYDKIMSSQWLYYDYDKYVSIFWNICSREREKRSVLLTPLCVGAHNVKFVCTVCAQYCICAHLHAWHVWIGFSRILGRRTHPRRHVYRIKINWYMMSL